MTTFPSQTDIGNIEKVTNAQLYLMEQNSERFPLTSNQFGYKSIFQLLMEPSSFVIWYWVKAENEQP